MKTKKLATAAVLTATAMMLSYVESLIPAFVAIPGIKIGLANIVTVFALYTIGWRGAICVSLVRVCLSSLLFGNVTGFFYSLTGALLSFLGMLLLSRISLFSPVAVSSFGGVLHNVGQIFASALVLETAAVFTYLPILLISGTIAGVVIGVAAGLLAKRLEGIVK